MEIFNLLNDHGWPAAFIGLLIYTFRAAAKAMVPRMDKLIDAHIGLVDSLKETTGEQGKKITEIHKHLTGQQE